MTKFPARRLAVGVGLVTLIALVAWAALPHHPGYQEWRCNNRSLTELEHLKRHLPESPIVLFHVGAALHKAGRSREAVPILQRAALLDQHSVRVRESLTQAQLAVGLTRETFDLLRRFLESHPDTPEAYHLLGRFLMGVQTYSRAIVVLEEATKRFPGDGLGWMLLASARQSFRDLRGAQDAITRATTLRPQDAEVWLLNARILNERGVPAQARESFSKAVHLAPDDVELKAECADFIARQTASPQDQVFARDLARRVLQQHPGHPRASGALGLLLAERNEAREAVPHLVRSLAQDPHDVRILRTLNLLARRAGSPITPSDATLWAQALQRAQSYRDQEKQLLDAISKKPGDATLLTRMAHLTGQNGDALKSLRYHAIALRLSPDASAPHLAVARDLHVGGYNELARQFAHRALDTSQAPGEQATARNFLTALQP